MTKYGHNPQYAFLFSLLFPGLGQFYNHEIIKALVYVSLFIILTYLFPPIGVLIVLIGSIDAYRKARVLNAQGFVSKYKNIVITLLISLAILAFILGFFASEVVKLIYQHQ